MFYFWDTNDVLPLELTIAGPTGAPSTGKSPEVSIRRILDADGAADDGQWWDGDSFVAIETWIDLVEVGAANPGTYRYLFVQDGTPRTYQVQYRHEVDPIGFAAEIHKVELNQATLPDSGLRAITVTLEDADEDPIPGALVDVFTSGGGTFLFRRVTDPAGQTSFSLDDGTFEIRLFAVGYSFDIETLVVNGDEDVTYEGTAAAGASLPSAPQLCVIFGTILDAGGGPVEGADVNAYAVTPQVFADAGAQAGTPIANTHTDEAGYFELELIRGALVRWQVEATGVDEERTVPDLASQDVATWT